VKQKPSRTGHQPLWGFSASCDPEGSLPSTQQLAARHCQEPDEFILWRYHNLFTVLFNIILPSTSSAAEWSNFFVYSDTKIRVWTSQSRRHPAISNEWVNAGFRRRYKWVKSQIDEDVGNWINLVHVLGVTNCRDIIASFNRAVSHLCRRTGGRTVRHWTSDTTKSQ